MPFGLVTNCWKEQLDAGEDLAALIADAVQSGFDVIELRQTCLGLFEQDDVPRADRLSELAAFPDVQFDVALCLPLLDPGLELDAALLQAGVEAARAVAGRFLPHLRLVDLATVDQLADVDPASAADRVARMTRTMVDYGGRLSIEHSFQPWRWFRAVFDEARERLAGDANSLRICFDPVNLLFPGDGADPVDVTTSLSPDEVSMIHFKQRRDGRPLPMMDAGEVDWPTLVPVINSKQFDCPGLLEIQSSPDVGQHLLDGRAYLRRLGLELAAESP